MPGDVKIVPQDKANTLSSIFIERVKATPQNQAYTQYDLNNDSGETITWQQVYEQVSLWQQALNSEYLVPGDRVAVMLRNSVEWICFDQAAMGLGLVVVPIYTNDRADNIAYILRDAGVKLLLVENGNQLHTLQEIDDELGELKRIVCLEKAKTKGKLSELLKSTDEWLPSESGEVVSRDVDTNELATIVYTSGTTGNPKGVMLSHRNILNNVYAGLSMVDVYVQDSFLSFLPLSHMLERSIGYYLPVVTGSSVAFSRSIPQLGEDLLEIRPTILISVPRIFERVYGKIQDKLSTESAIKNKLFNAAIKAGWKKFEHQQDRQKFTLGLLIQPLLDKLVGAKVREKLGGRLRYTVCGGAPLSDGVAKFFIGLGIPILQGYGLTETAPVISVNTLEDNIPNSVGLPLKGIDIKIGDNDELLTKSDSIMLGYWHNDIATHETIGSGGWLHTGDKVKIEHGHIFITGRLKEIIVLANGEKVPPSDMELAISLDNLIEQAMVIGEGRPYLSALIVLNQEELKRYCHEHNLDAEADNTGNTIVINEIMSRIKQALHQFPGYAKIRKITLENEAWSIENGLMTPTLKLKRNKIIEKYKDEIDWMYEGH